MSSLKIAHIADLHLGAKLRTPNSEAVKRREEEISSALDEILDKVSDYKPDLVIVAGDLFDLPTPAIDSEDKGLRLLKAIGQIATTVVIPGNHDSLRRFQMYSELLSVYNVKVFHTLPRTVEELRECIFQLDKSVVICGLPFVYPYKLSGFSTFKCEHESLSYNVDEALWEYSKRLASVFRALYREASSKTDGYIILVAHVFVDGANIAGDEVAVSVTTEWGIRPADIPPFNYVALGHVHRAQRVPGTNAWYSGSPWALNFGEGQREHGFLTVKLLSENLTPEVKFIKLESVGDMVTLDVDLKNWRDMLRSVNPKAYVKLRFKDDVPEFEGIIASAPNVVKIELNLRRAGRKRRDTLSRDELKRVFTSPLELYRLYYKSQHSSEPSEELLEELKRILGELGEEVS